MKQDSRYKGNLSAFDPTRRKRPAKPLARPKSAPDSNGLTPGMVRVAEARFHTDDYVEFGALPSNQVAANSDTAFPLPELLRDLTPGNKVAIAAFSLLTLGALAGFVITAPEKKEDAVVQVPGIQPAAGNPENTALAGTAESPPQNVATTPVVTSAKAPDIKSEHLDEIDWLLNQKDGLELKLDVMNKESLDLNQELLKLELEVVELKSQAEPPVESRLVYNFVNVPIGASAQTEPYDPSLDEGSANPILQEISQTDDPYTHSDLTVDESNEASWQSNNDNYPQDREISYDPETGYYINPQYTGETAVPIIDSGQEISYPPIAPD